MLHFIFSSCICREQRIHIISNTRNEVKGRKTILTTLVTSINDLSHENFFPQITRLPELKIFWKHVTYFVRRFQDVVMESCHVVWDFELDDMTRTVSC